MCKMIRKNNRRPPIRQDLLGFQTGIPSTSSDRPRMNINEGNYQGSQAIFFSTIAGQECSDKNLAGTS